MSKSNELISFLKETYPALMAVPMNPHEAVFEENVKMNCFYCGRYNNNWRCPPNIPQIDYPKMFSEYDRGLFVIASYEYDDENYESIRNESNLVVHRALLTLEKWMWDNNNSTSLSFIGGSCRLCKSGCGKERCNNPYMSRTPLEATGMQVVKTAAKFGIDIQFPTNKQMKRIGLLLWQEG